MSDPAPEDRMEAAPDSRADVDASIASLRAAGADRFDPVRLRYIEALARRAAEREGRLKGLLDARAFQALAAFKARFDAARNEAESIAAQGVRQYPHVAEMLQQHLASGDFKILRTCIAKLEARDRTASLGALTRLLEQTERTGQAAPGDAAARPQAPAGARPELRTVRRFRDDLSRLSADRQVAQALEQAPKNAGPINSHMLVLRSLALMRDISPDYLSRFISYADTLLFLEQEDNAKPGNEKPSPAKKPARTGKPRSQA